MKNGILLIVLLSAVWGCSTAQVRVMPGEDNNRVIVRDIERDNAEEEAVDAAHEYCKKRNMEAVFIEDPQDTEYTGDMEESTRKTLRTGSKVAMILGGASSVGKRSRGMGGVVGTAGAIGYGMTSGRDYKSELKFRCR